MTVFEFQRLFIPFVLFSATKFPPRSNEQASQMQRPPRQTQDSVCLRTARGRQKPPQGHQAVPLLSDRHAVHSSRERRVSAQSRSYLKNAPPLSAREHTVCFGQAAAQQAHAPTRPRLLLHDAFVQLLQKQHDLPVLQGW